MKIIQKNKCRVSQDELKIIWDLGEFYLSDFYDAKEEHKEIAPLRLSIGKDSQLIQLKDTVDRDSLYKQYWYVSGTNSTMTQQLLDIVNVVPNWLRLDTNDIVLDIGCNDGTLLNHYESKNKVIKIGVDPATNTTKKLSKDIDIFINDYFTKETFLSSSNGKKAKVITSIAMFYDLDDPLSFTKDIKQSLADDGIWIVQLSYTPLMLMQNAFDNIIHEHLEYYSLKTIDYILKKNDLKILDVEFNNTNGGSIRVVATHIENNQKNVSLYNKDIGEIRLNSTLDFESKYFAEPEQSLEILKDKVNDLKIKTLDFLDNAKRNKKKVVGYGASTKGNTLLQYYGIDNKLVECIAERQELKVGKLTPGSWIPIVSEKEMRKMKPDYLFILPWHFSTEFYKREKELIQNGTALVVPLPNLEILN